MSMEVRLEFLRAKYPVTADIVKNLIETEMSGWTASEGISIYVNQNQTFNFNDQPQLLAEFQEWFKEWLRGKD